MAQTQNVRLSITPPEVKTLLAAVTKIADQPIANISTVSIVVGRGKPHMQIEYTHPEPVTGE